jgi:hypothetical protein
MLEGPFQNDIIDRILMKQACTIPT